MNSQVLLVPPTPRSRFVHLSCEGCRVLAAPLNWLGARKISLACLIPRSAAKHVCPRTDRLVKSRQNIAEDPTNSTKLAKNPNGSLQTMTDKIATHKTMNCQLGGSQLMLGTNSLLYLPREYSIFILSIFQYWDMEDKTVGDNPALKGSLGYVIFRGPFQPAFLWFPWLFTEINSPRQGKEKPNNNNKAEHQYRQNSINPLRFLSSNSLKVTVAEVYNITSATNHIQTCSFTVQPGTHPQGFISSGSFGCQLHVFAPYLR